MKTEAEMQTEGRKILKWRNRYTPIHNNRKEAKAQTKLNQGHKQ